MKNIFNENKIIFNNDGQEKILLATYVFQMNDETYYFAGNRHGIIYRTLERLIPHIDIPFTLEDFTDKGYGCGFLTSHGRVVGRREALKIAREANQLMAVDSEGDSYEIDENFGLDSMWIWAN